MRFNSRPSLTVLLLPLWLTVAALAASTSSSSNSTSSNSSSSSTCRFASRFNLSSIQNIPGEFINQVMTYEGRFHSAAVGYNPANGMTFDGTLLDVVTGERNASGGHNFSAASKESLQMMVYAHVLAGDAYAARFIRGNDWNVSAAQDEVLGILRVQLKTYLAFNVTYPGFGGYLPWFQNIPGNSSLSPTYDWVNRLPALDNGELLWAVYAVISAIEDSGHQEWQDVASGFQGWLDHTKQTAVKLFYRGGGRVCSVIDLNQTLQLDDPQQNISCEGGITALLNDPYEGELFTWWLYFFAPQLNDTDREDLWAIKRPQLVALNYTGSVVNISASDGAPYNFTNRDAVVHPLSNGPITVQRGFWFSAHEQWKILEMPYLDVPLLKRVFMNAERMRTCDANLINNAGLFASVNNVTNTSTNDVIGYISNAGVPSVSNQTDLELDVITPYGSFPSMLFNQTLGLAWYHNMLLGKGMQNPYGSSEATKRDGTAISAFVSWDSKITTVNGILGGTAGITKRKMMRDGIYDAFVKRIGDEYGLVFGQNGENLYGEDVELCYPQNTIPDGGAKDFTTCS